MQSELFEWDDEKAAINKTKHGVCFEEAETVFADTALMSMEDGMYDGETRYRSLGLSNQARLLVVVWTFRGNKIRIISSWKADKRRRNEYANK